MTSTKADLKARPGLVNRCRRGDVIAWAEIRSYTLSNGSTVTPVKLYTIGIVKSVSRDGLVKTADTGMGTATVYHNVDSAAVRGEMIDLDKARAWLKSSENYPRTGSKPLHSMDEVRQIVRHWLKP